jgi:hypothetical protein
MVYSSFPVGSIVVSLLFLLRGEIGEWVPLEVTEARLPQLVGKGLPSKEVAWWRAAARDIFPFPQPSEVVSFTDFHERGFTILTLDFFHGFLHEYGIQLQHLPPNAMLRLAGFVVVYEAFLGIEPNMDLFQRVFEVRTRKAHGSDDGMLAQVSEMNI